MADFCDMSSVSIPTRDALETYSACHDYDEWLGRRTYIEPRYLAWLTFLLQLEPDSEELFPKGKWATIQRLQQIVTESAQTEIRDRGEVENG